jgi:glucan phosphoethanolaminetransferase (alkaline phosphatase superfamily)
MTRRKIFIWIAVLCALQLVIAFYYYVTASSGYMPQCFFKSLTGWQCPGCGSQRMLHALLHGNISEAIAYNYFMPIILIFVLIAAWMDIVCSHNTRKYRWIYRANIPLIFILLIVGWTIVRNILNI